MIKIEERSTVKVPGLTSLFVSFQYNKNIVDCIKKLETSAAEEEQDGGFIILNIDNNKIGIIIDKIARVVTVDMADVKDPPQMISGIGTEYIQGVIRQENHYLIMLNIRKLFNPKELQKIFDAE